MSLRTILVLSAVLFSFNAAFAQHHGGEAAPPISFGNKQVTVATWLEPADFDPTKHSMATLKARFYDSQTNTNIEKVTYRIQIFSGESLLASQMFYDSDGELQIRIQPSSECAEKELWRCTKYDGDKDPVVPSALTSSATSIPVMRGPVFDKSGVYTVKVSIIGATNPKTQTTEDINFETNINIAHEQKFSLKTSSGQTSITVKAFSDKLTNLQFSESTNTLSFEMPFHWEHAEHTQLVRNDIEIPKSFAPFQNVNSFKGTVNGVPIFPKDIHFDPYSSKDTNIIHFLITNEELKILKNKIDDEHTMIVEITPDTSNAIKSTNVEFSNGYQATVSYDSRYGASKDVQFTIAFFEPAGSLAKEIRYAYSVKDSTGDEFIVNTGNNANLIGISVPSGVDSRLITIPSKGSYTLQLVLVGRGLIDFDQFVPAIMQFEIGEAKPQDASQTPKPAQAAIPNWIRNNAKWWADGTIGDTDFVQGIQFLIKEGILKIPPTTMDKAPTSSQIPAWVKNNAKWWSEGTITDDDFVKGIQFLVSQGIIRV
ncbi:MAG TPA: peptidase [Candidatus Nitrosotenuis sp.]|nr:peptidase [Candidatus Nitrosotenuis sp.]